MEGMRL